MANTFPYNAAQGSSQGYGLDLGGFGTSPAARREATFGAVPYDPRLVARLLQNPDGDIFNRTNGAAPPAMGDPNASEEVKPPPSGDKIDQFLDENLLLQEMISMHPMDIVGGGLAGTGLGLAMAKADKGGLFQRAAVKIDRAPVIRWLSDKLNRYISNPLQRFEWYKTLNPVISEADKALKPEEFAAKMAKAEQARQIEQILKPLSRRAGNAPIDELLRKINSGSGKHSFAALKNIADDHYKELAEKTLSRKAEPGGQHLFRRLWSWIARRTFTSKAEKEAFVLSHRVRDLANSGLQHTLPKYEERMRMLLEIHQKSPTGSIGPIGKGLTTFSNDLRMVMGGETMMRGAGIGAETFKKSNFLSKFLGPFLNGWLMIGQAIRAGRKAQDGEKVQTFFHNLFGIGISSFLGWQIGSRTLRSMKIHNVILGRLSGAKPFPLWVLRVFPKLTLGGMIVEIAAMFIIGGIFQKFGEKLAHRIFGKPSEESIDPAAAAEAAKQKQQMTSTPAGDLHHFRKGFTSFEEAQHGSNPQARSAERKPTELKTEEQLTDQNPAIAPEHVPPSALPPGDIAVNKTQSFMGDTNPDLSVGALQMNGLLPSLDDVWMPGSNNSTPAKSNRKQMESFFPGPEIGTDTGKGMLFTEEL